MGEKGKIKNIILNVLFVGVLLFSSLIILPLLIEVVDSVGRNSLEGIIYSTILFLIPLIIIFSLIRLFLKRGKMNPIMTSSRLIVLSYPLIIGFAYLLSLNDGGVFGSGLVGLERFFNFLIFSFIIVVTSLIMFIIGSYKKYSPEEETTRERKLFSYDKEELLEQQF